MLKDYSTTDICLSVALKCHGHVMDKLTVTPPSGRATFHFKDIPADFVERYDKGLTLVEPYLFHTTIRALNVAIKRQRGVSSYEDPVKS